MKFAPGRTLVPDLAESVVEDPDGLTITVKLIEGVMFHDGTELTAEVAKWNYDMGAANGKLQFADCHQRIRDRRRLQLRAAPELLAQPAAAVPRLGPHVLPGRLLRPTVERPAGLSGATEHLVGTGPFIARGVQPRPVPHVGQEPQLLGWQTSTSTASK